MIVRALVLISMIAAAPGAARAADGGVDALLGDGLSVVDSSGTRVDSASLQDRWKLVIVGYTSCPDVCPFALGSLAAAYREIVAAGERRSVRPPAVLFLSVDPERDLIDDISGYVDHFHPDFMAATGDRKAIDRAVRKLGATYWLNRPDADGFYTVDHTAFVHLVSPAGEVKAKLAPPVSAKKLSRVLGRLLPEEGRAG